ncbi:BrnA antitoxin family protein [Ferrovum sp.]|uniref:BrnA antitoxin family protein n=1 Tax=Ferrovum sp. TaxID=2609467 RepID=UPI00261D286D|nr:BrnA antitoxin family protein [Ferrovum sp.]
MNANKHATHAEWVDPDDAPELTDEFFGHADEYVSENLVRRGRPKATSTKLALTVRYDSDVVEAFRVTGKGWQTRMNAALRDWLKTHSPAG